MSLRTFFRTILRFAAIAALIVIGPSAVAQHSLFVGVWNGENWRDSLAVGVRGNVEVRNAGQTLIVVLYQDFSLTAGNRVQPICGVRAALSVPTQGNNWDFVAQSELLRLDIKLEPNQTWNPRELTRLVIPLDVKHPKLSESRLTLDIVVPFDDRGCVASVFAHSRYDIFRDHISYAQQHAAETARVRSVEQAAEAQRLAAAIRLAEDQVENRAKRFIQENLSACTWIWPISNVRLDVEKLTFSVQTGSKRFDQFEADLRGATVHADKKDFKLECGAGNCKKWSFDRTPSDSQTFECGSTGTASSLARAFEAYITKLPKAPTF
jgi:hypothetical protein